ncbi:MAG: patatin-like phospholipase family protein [Sutterella wadsworthensis]
MQLKKIAILTLAAFGLAATCTQPLAKTADEIRARCRAEHRPCVGLVLSGGGARGFAHTGVLDVIEELGIKIDVVTGTSMGSMIGGAYAAGYSAAEIRDIVLGVDWDRMMARRRPRGAALAPQGGRLQESGRLGHRVRQGRPREAPRQRHSVRGARPLPQ